MKHGDAVEFESVDGWVLAKYNATATARCHRGYVFVIWNGCDMMLPKTLIRKAA